MPQIHPNARTTPATRAEIARSQDPAGLLAQRCGVSTETIRKWRKRGTEDCLDHSAKPHRLPWKATEEERAINRCPRFVELAVKDDGTERSAIAFLREAAAAFPFRLTHVLADNGSCFTPAFIKACVDLGAQHRHAKPRTPQANGVVERFNGRVGSEALGINITSHQALEQLLRGCNARRQRVLASKTPDQVVAERLEAAPTLAKGQPQGRAGTRDTKGTPKGTPRR